MLYLQIESPKSSVLNFLDSNSFEVIISIFQRTEKVPDMERLQENSVIITVLLSENGSHKYEFVGTEWLNPQGDNVTHLSARGA